MQPCIIAISGKTAAGDLLKYAAENMTLIF